MGVDEALLVSAARDGRCSLRLYRWDGPWLSLGYAQRLLPGLLEECRGAGVGVVRRASGGRAVLHGCDLTYSIGAPEHRLRPGRRASYELVSRVLLEALLAVGVRARRSAQSTPGPGRNEFDCFAAAAADEICVSGRKLVGSAQRWAGGVLLQHGSIRLRPDPASATRAAELSEAGATSLYEQGCEASSEVLEEAFLAAFRRLCGARLQVGQLTDKEREQARRRCLSHAENPVVAPAPGGQLDPWGILKSAVR